MSAVFSITVNGYISFLEKQVENILHYNPDCYVVIHINKENVFTPEEQKILDRILFNKKVFNNNNRVITKPKKIQTPQLSNILFSKDLDYEYFVMLASNELFFRTGAFKYMQNFDAGCFKNVATSMHEGMESANNFVKFLGGVSAFNGQHEGMFFRKKIILNIAENILKFCPLENQNNLHDCVEEWIFATALHNIYSNIKLGYPITILRDRAPDILGTDSQNNIASVAKFIDIMRTKNYFDGTYVLQTPINSIFSIKRVSRDCGRDVNFAINQLINDLPIV